MVYVIMAKCVLSRMAQNKMFCRLDSEINSASVNFILANSTPFSFITTLGLHGKEYGTIFNKILWKRGLVGNKLAQPSISVRDFC